MQTWRTDRDYIRFVIFWEGDAAPCGAQVEPVLDGPVAAVRDFVDIAVPPGLTKMRRAIETAAPWRQIIDAQQDTRPVEHVRFPHFPDQRA